MTDPIITFAGGKRIAVEPDKELVTIRGKHHVERVPFDRLDSRMALYKSLHAKRPKFYLDAIKAVQAAQDVVAGLTSRGATP